MHKDITKFLQITTMSLQQFNSLQRLKIEEAINKVKLIVSKIRP